VDAFSLMDMEVYLSVEGISRMLFDVDTLGFQTIFAKEIDIERVTFYSISIFLSFA